MGIGSRLAKLIEANNTNPNELAKRVGVPAQTIYSMIKRDSKKADIEVLIKIADIFGVTVEYFVDDENKPITIAAHFDGDEYTEEELDEIRQFAEFVKNKRKQKYSFLYIKFDMLEWEGFYMNTYECLVEEAYKDGIDVYESKFKNNRLKALYIDKQPILTVTNILKKNWTKLDSLQNLLRTRENRSTVSCTLNLICQSGRDFV